MKDFLKVTLAVVCGMLLFGVLSLFVFVAFANALASSASGKAVLPREGVLMIDMSKVEIAEQPRPFNPATVFNSQGSEIIPTIGILETVRAINIAAEDPAVKFICLKPEGIVNGSVSEIEELRAALAHFRSGGKPVVARMESPTTLSYYLGSVADKVYLSSYLGSMYLMGGVSGRLIHLKDLLDACDINVQLIRCGKYKSAGEMFVTNAPSPENMEQNKAMISSLWDTMASAIAQSRDISVDDLNKAIDDLKLDNPQAFIDAHLADELMDSEQFNEKLAALAGKSSISDVGFINLADYVTSKNITSVKSMQKMAVIYADGEIIDGDGLQEVAGARYAQMISKVRTDSTIKAVVFRVNSPGGSVYASEQIKAEIDLLCEMKPVVASYGSYAASGGYWISNNCEKVFSDASTLTGSIGVFSIIPDLGSAIKNKLHVGVFPVNSNKHSDMFQCMRPLDKEERDFMQGYTDMIYGRFINIVASGRDLEPDYVASIAEGRVWTGADAVGVGLVDEIGTLEDAVKWAAIAGSGDASQSDISKWNIVSYPEPMTTLDLIMEMFGGTDASVNPLSGTALEGVASSVIRWTSSLDLSEKTNRVFARMPYVEIK